MPKQTDREFNIRVCRNTLKAIWEKLGLGKYDRKPKVREGLTPHDFRRNSARNLVKAGADHRPAMKITDHKTEAILA